MNPQTRTWYCILQKRNSQFPPPFIYRLYPGGIHWTLFSSIKGSRLGGLNSAWKAVGRLSSVLTCGFLPRPGLAHFLLIFNADLLTRWCILQLVFPSDKLYRHGNPTLWIPKLEPDIVFCRKEIPNFPPPFHFSALSRWNSLNQER